MKLICVVSVASCKSGLGFKSFGAKRFQACVCRRRLEEKLICFASVASCKTGLGVQSFGAQRFGACVCVYVYMSVSHEFGLKVDCFVS